MLERVLHPRVYPWRGPRRMPGSPKQRTTTAWLGHLSGFPTVGMPHADRASPKIPRRGFTQCAAPIVARRACRRGRSSTTSIGRRRRAPRPAPWSCGPPDALRRLSKVQSVDHGCALECGVGFRQLRTAVSQRGGVCGDVVPVGCWPLRVTAAGWSVPE